jgi:signal transduction histidine kinase
LAVGLLDGLAAAPVTQLYSLPVVLAAYSDGWRGGVGAAILSSAVLALAGVESAAIGSIGLASLGVLTGIGFQWERRRTSHFQKTAEQLGSVYQRVQANFEGMKRIERLSAVGQLSAGLAHEIRNPLASIAGAAGILRRNDNLDAKYLKCIEIITHECQRLDDLLTNFLNFARPRPPRLRNMRLEDSLENVAALASHGVRGKTVHCIKQTPADLPIVECDPEQLEQVLLNLMINAIEASPDGETVTLSAEEEDGKVAVRVIDNGHGVAPAHVDRLFDPFFTTKEHGTGLGLPVAHQIMTQMGGMLRAERNPDRGMTFSVVLPVKHERT